MLIIGMLIALGFFFYMNNRRIRRMEDQHERSKERFEKLLDTLRAKEDQEATRTTGEEPGK